MRSRRAILWLLVPATLLLGMQQATKDAAALSAKQILDRMGATYANCKTYADSGSVHSEFVSLENRRTSSDLTFRTAFVRPDAFRFEYDETKSRGRASRYIVWQKGTEVSTWWDVHDPHIEKPESLDMAVAGATGVSHGSAHTIPALLQINITGMKLTDLTELQRLDDATADGRPCFVVKGTWRTFTETIWIDQESMLIRQIQQEIASEKGRSFQTSTYEPALDSQIDDAQLAFDPPSSK